MRHHQVRVRAEVREGMEDGDETEQVWSTNRCVLSPFFFQFNSKIDGRSNRHTFPWRYNCTFLCYFWASLMTYMKKNLHFWNLKKKRVTDRRTDGPTDGQTLLKRCEDASKNILLVVLHLTKPVSHRKWDYTWEIGRLETTWGRFFLRHNMTQL